MVEGKFPRGLNPPRLTGGQKSHTVPQASTGWNARQEPQAILPAG